MTPNNGHDVRADSLILLFHLVNLGLTPSPHLHQVIGGLFQRDHGPEQGHSRRIRLHNLPALRSSNYWTAASKATAFQPGFRMIIGDPIHPYRGRRPAHGECSIPNDGKNLDGYSHMGQMAYPASCTFDSRGPCPSFHPVRVPQLMYETVWDTRQFNNSEDWPADGS
ncbi:hypothetical protein F5X97DRAFT_324494 [Nemania serpens]|nr:hypothetical protein F5X97DRAFT_324494 [Nemania serpens]